MKISKSITHIDFNNFPTFIEDFRISDSISGVPISGTHFQNVYALSNSTQNLNLVIFTQLFPELSVVPKTSEKTHGRYSSLDRKKMFHENTSKLKQGMIFVKFGILQNVPPFQRSSWFKTVLIELKAIIHIFVNWTSQREWV